MWSTRCSTFTSRRGVDHLSDWAIDLTRVRARLEEGQQEFNADTKTWLRICSRWSEAQKASAERVHEFRGGSMRVGLCVGLLYTPSGGLRPHPRNSGAAPRNSQIFQKVGARGASAVLLQIRDFVNLFP